MTDHSDFDFYDNDAFNDEAFAALLDGLKEAESSRNDEVNATTPEVYNHEYKFPCEIVSELNGRIEQSTISPFDRFRSQRGMLSVTDIVGLDWCETKFHYALEGGTRRKTDAMRQGQIIHKELESELHQTVTFTQITTTEEIWALRFLNILFGLRELQFHEMTVNPSYLNPYKQREFPIFGYIENHLVAGIIDQIAQEPSERRPMDAFVTMTRKDKLIISDVKTRVSSSLPRVRNTRASEMQLSLYYQLLSNMIDGVVDMSRVYSEMMLDAEGCFSDGFLAEAGMSYSDTGVLAFDTLLENNNLNKLWQVVTSELSKLRGRLSTKMEIEYRHQTTNQIIGSKSFEYHHNTTTSYVHRVLEWWDGKRATEGVEIEEAYKCRTCEYEEGCSWRIAKLTELAQKRQCSPLVQCIY